MLEGFISGDGYGSGCVVFLTSVIGYHEREDEQWKWVFVGVFREVREWYGSSPVYFD